MSQDHGRAVALERDVAATPVDRVALDYEGRMLRRKRLVCASGGSVLVDLPETVSCDAGDAFVLETGGYVIVEAADEPLMQVRGPLARLAWHIGNRHTPCQFLGDHLVIRADPVLQRMLEGLGAEVAAVDGPFRPEGGAYGLGRTMGHSHGPDDHHHNHDHDH